MNYFGHLKARSVGIVGGLGPETTTEFYLEIIRRFRNKSNHYPSILIDNVSFPFYLEDDIIRNSTNEERLLPFLKECIRKLNTAQVDFIVIPCNTVHVFIDELREVSQKPIISILDETVKEIKTKGFRKVGILATTKSIESNLYQIPLKKNDIDVVIPSKNDQKLLSAIIVRILRNKSRARMYRFTIDLKKD